MSEQRFDFKDKVGYLDNPINIIDLKEDQAEIERVASILPDLNGKNKLQNKLQL